jgi:hypothetical protein
MKSISDCSREPADVSISACTAWLWTDVLRKALPWHHHWPGGRFRLLDLLTTNPLLFVERRHSGPRIHVRIALLCSARLDFEAGASSTKLAPTLRTSRKAIASWPLSTLDVALASCVAKDCPRLASRPINPTCRTPCTETGLAAWCVIRNVSRCL